MFLVKKETGLMCNDLISSLRGVIFTAKQFSFFNSCLGCFAKSAHNDKIIVLRKLYVFYKVRQSSFVFLWIALQKALVMTGFLATALTLCLYSSELSAKRDPTKPAEVSAQVTSMGDFEIDAILIKKNNINNVVIIKGNSFMVGDLVAGAKIIAINQNNIKLRDNNGDFMVAMPYLTVKTVTAKTYNKKKI